MDQGAWWATVHGVVESQTWLRDWYLTHTHTHTHTHRGCISKRAYLHLTQGTPINPGSKCCQWQRDPQRRPSKGMCLTDHLVPHQHGTQNSECTGKQADECVCVYVITLPVWLWEIFLLHLFSHTLKITKGYKGDNNTLLTTSPSIPASHSQHALPGSNYLKLF